MDTAFTSEGVIRLNTEELPAVQYEGMRVSDLLKEKGDKMIYRYDFGDDWEREHQRALLHQKNKWKILQRLDKEDIPVAIVSARYGFPLDIAQTGQNPGSDIVIYKSSSKYFEAILRLPFPYLFNLFSNPSKSARMIAGIWTYEATTRASIFAGRILNASTQSSIVSCICFIA
jgi:hypothetical protein